MTVVDINTIRLKKFIQDYLAEYDVNLIYNNLNMEIVIYDNTYTVQEYLEKIVLETKLSTRFLQGTYVETMLQKICRCISVIKKQPKSFSGDLLINLSDLDVGKKMYITRRSTDFTGIDFYLEMDFEPEIISNMLDIIVEAVDKMYVLDGVRDFKGMVIAKTIPGLGKVEIVITENMGTFTDILENVGMDKRKVSVFGTRAKLDSERMTTIYKVEVRKKL